jgi:hypothetical protein
MTFNKEIQLIARKKCASKVAKKKNFAIGLHMTKRPLSAFFLLNVHHYLTRVALIAYPGKGLAGITTNAIFKGNVR